LEAAGYLVRWDCCPASVVGALHRRDRVFIVATRVPTGWPAMSVLPIAHESMWGHPQPLEWPRAGAWSEGAAFQSRPLWPVPSAPVDFNTPCRKDGEKYFSEGECKRDSLTGQIGRMIPTPQATESRNFTSGRRNPNSAHHSGVTIYDYVRMWPTPTSRDWKDGDSHSIANVPDNGLLGRVAARDTEAGALNPDWVEWLMGFPIGWTQPDGPSMHGIAPLPLGSSLRSAGSRGPASRDSLGP
jgi:site-specific DNA-cytosine methylase